MGMYLCHPSMDVCNVNAALAESLLLLLLLLLLLISKYGRGHMFFEMLQPVIGMLLLAGPKSGCKYIDIFSSLFSVV